MAWLVLICAGGLEMVWAAALAASNGLRRWKPAVLFAVTMLASLAGLAYAMTAIPVGTAYAVWVGIGATLTLIWGFATGQEKLTVGRSLLVLLLIASIVGLKAVS